jgi:hypothetical protein
LQQQAFSSEWLRLMPEIRRVKLDWEPPTSGYFSVIGLPFTILLHEHGILSVPATVFGAATDELSVVTCLHDLAAHAKPPIFSGNSD